ncbi:hypothetical protein MesoLjLc_12510 [Mesorhizobium sp. L-8-10]|uniref:hypothetical protein n=1 Tax=Mesorhizobium sp. L-8-10 TaxID=2744523 RepID=UPI001926DDAC|nr:hypothetical protein [Mesorhizobium sp. L-8-10]BCH29321.1 hypothetical protein MesoLjLc_12510 [Mesorhizobium sp. L-8-10]
MEKTEKQIRGIIEAIKEGMLQPLMKSEVDALEARKAELTEILGLLGSLDHPEDWPLTKDAAWGQTEHVFIESKVPWYEINDGLPQTQANPSELMVATAAAIDYRRRSSFFTT